MKQITTNTPSMSSLDHSMIDENTRKGWQYYAEHSGQRSSSSTTELASQKAPRATRRKPRSASS